jgi:hypothetical protein
METEMTHERRTTWLRLVPLLSCVAISQGAFAQSSGIDAGAQRLLKASTDFLAAQKRFSVDTLNTIEVVLTSGQRLQFDSAAKLDVQRPNLLRAERRGELVDQVFYYDGKSLTLSNPRDGFFATVDAPPTIEAMLDMARDKLDIVAPGTDLIYANAYDTLMQGVTSGFIVGKSAVDGVRCDHLAFRSADTDWQIWIQEGARPLPRKLVITSKDIAGMPQFVVSMNKWDLAPKFTGDTFAFKPARGAKLVEFAPVAK